jgi:hypothetical protein
MRRAQSKAPILLITLPAKKHGRPLNPDHKDFIFTCCISVTTNHWSATGCWGKCMTYQAFAGQQQGLDMAALDVGIRLAPLISQPGGTWGANRCAPRCAWKFIYVFCNNLTIYLY